MGRHVCACRPAPPPGTLAPKPPLQRALGGPPCTHQPCTSCQNAFPAALGLPHQRQEPASGPDKAPVMSRGPCEPWPAPHAAPRLRCLGLGAGSGPSSAQRPPSLCQDPRPPTSPPPPPPCPHAFAPAQSPPPWVPTAEAPPASSTGAPGSPAHRAPDAQLSEGAEGTPWSPFTPRRSYSANLLHLHAAFETQLRRLARHVWVSPHPGVPERPGPAQDDPAPGPVMERAPLPAEL